LPEVRAPVRICLGPEVEGVRTGLVARYPDGTTEDLPADIARAYEVVSDRVGTNITFSKGVLKRHSYGRPFLGGSLGCAVEDQPGYTQLLLSFTDAQHIRLLKDAWTDFLELDRRWREDPTFYRSYAWLSSHPAFWTRQVGTLRPGDADWSDESLWSWETDGYVPEVSVYPGPPGTGKAVVALEAGAHVPESEHWDRATKTKYVIEGSYTEHYADFRLEVSAGTYEKAIRKLARRVDRYYDVDGSERPGVHHKLTKLEKTLRRRLKGMNRVDTQPAVRVAFADSANLHLGTGR